MARKRVREVQSACRRLGHCYAIALAKDACYCYPSLDAADAVAGDVEVAVGAAAYATKQAAAHDSDIAFDVYVEVETKPAQLAKEISTIEIVELAAPLLVHLVAQTVACPSSLRPRLIATLTLFDSPVLDLDFALGKASTPPHPVHHLDSSSLLVDRSWAIHDLVPSFPAEVELPD